MTIFPIAELERLTAALKRRPSGLSYPRGVLLEYRCSTFVELIYNDQTGEVPLTLTSKRGERLQLDPPRARFYPTFQPGVGDRIFAAPTPETAWKEAEGVCHDRWENELERKYGTKGQAIAAIAKWIIDSKSAILLSVTEVAPAPT
jgi:hypothetical protein